MIIPSSWVASRLFSPIYSFPVCYELTILLGPLSARLFGMLFLNRLPRLHHPLFKSTAFCQGHS